MIGTETVFETWVSNAVLTELRDLFRCYQGTYYFSLPLFPLPFSSCGLLRLGSISKKVDPRPFVRNPSFRNRPFLRTLEYRTLQHPNIREAETVYLIIMKHKIKIIISSWPPSGYQLSICIVCLRNSSKTSIGIRTWLTKQLWVRLGQQFFFSSSDVNATTSFDHSIIIRRQTVVYCRKRFAWLQ
jgi:hypothetical protein